MWGLRGQKASTKLNLPASNQLLNKFMFTFCTYVMLRSLFFPLVKPHGHHDGATCEQSHVVELYTPAWVRIWSAWCIDDLLRWLWDAGSKIAPQLLGGDNLFKRLSQDKYRFVDTRSCANEYTWCKRDLCKFISVFLLYFNPFPTLNQKIPKAMTETEPCVKHRRSLTLRVLAPSLVI